MNTANNSQDLIDLPIGVFDSGVGGLTVLHALKTTLPNESFLYLGDTARLPYGTKSADTIINYAKQAAQLLIHSGIKVLVIACNTASALALNALQEYFADLPLIGVVKPGAEVACATSVNGHIAVIATEATVRAQGYQRAITKFRPLSIVASQACSLFVALAEEGWTEGEIVEAVAKRYLQPLLATRKEFKPDCLILGCTHFPVLIKPIKKVVGEKITIVDSAETTAQKVKTTLQQQNLLRTEKKSSLTNFFVTDSPQRFARVAERFLGEKIIESDVELVDLNFDKPNELK